MPVLSRTIFVGFQAVALVATVGPASGPLAALAAPIAAPMPLMPHIADYASRPPARNNVAVVTPTNGLSTAEDDQDDAVVKHTTSDVSPVVRRQADDVTNLKAYAAILDDLALASPTTGQDPEVGQQALAALTGFKNSLDLFRLALDGEATDKGLENYDANVPLETILKDVVNAIKNVLSSLTTLVYNIPTVGPLLGPIVYEVKCIIDGLLDNTEVITDGTINELQPLIADLMTMVCNLTVDVGLDLSALCDLLR